MGAYRLLHDFHARGIRLSPEGGMLAVEPAERLSEVDRAAIRQHKAELLALLARPAPRTMTPDSRHPLVPAEIRAKIEAIEADARAKGWPAELLWNGGFWECPRGLAAVLDPDDEIAEVTPHYITILKYRRDVQRFQRHVA